MDVNLIISLHHLTSPPNHISFPEVDHSLILGTQKSSLGDFFSGPVVKNPPSSAADVGSIPGWGTKIPHAVGQLSP